LLADKYKRLNEQVSGPTPILITDNFPDYYTYSCKDARSPGKNTPYLDTYGNEEISDDNSDDDSDDGKQKQEAEDLLQQTGQNSNHFRPTEPFPNLQTELHPYQKQALTWMLHREEIVDESLLFENKPENDRELSDLFEELIFLDGSKFYFNPFNGDLTLQFPYNKNCRGGILADEMGLGKTVMAIALIHSHKQDC